MPSMMTLKLNMSYYQEMIRSAKLDGILHRFIDL